MFGFLDEKAFQVLQCQGKPYLKLPIIRETGRKEEGMPVKEMKEVALRVPASCRPTAHDREKHEITESIEEYTEGIYRLQEEMEIVSTGDIAKYMSVQPASVTTMLKKLSEIGLAEHNPYKGVRLTEKGEQLSISLLRKHRLVER